MNSLKTLLLIFFSSVIGVAAEAELKPKRIAVLNPGALHGYVQALVLEALELRLQKPLSEYFDFFGGTSTGAVIASLLTNGEEGKPKYTMTQIREFYEKFAQDIFGDENQISFAASLRPEELDEFNIQMFKAKILGLVEYVKQYKIDLASHISDMESIFKSDGRDGLISMAISIIMDQLSEKGNYEKVASEVRYIFSHDTSSMANLFLMNWQKFLSLLGENLGSSTTLSTTLKPLAVFTLATKMSSASALFWQEYGYFNTVDFSPFTFASYNESLSSVELYKAIYASATMKGFRALELSLAGYTTFLDGDCLLFSSTLQRTAAAARDLWPNHPLQIIEFGYGESFDDSNYIGSAIPITSASKVLFSPREGRETLHVVRPIKGQSLGASNPSLENFLSMRQAAEKYIKSAEFETIVGLLENESSI